MSIKTVMTFEQYKEEVENALVKLKHSRKEIDYLMSSCSSDILEAYQLGWDPMSMALPISMNLI